MNSSKRGNYVTLAPPSRSRYILVYFLSLLLFLTLTTSRCAWASIDNLAISGDVYLIGNAEELKTFRDYVNNEAETRVEEGRNYVNVSAVLTADIDLKGEVWTPICDDSQGTGRAVRYEGTFDGAGYAIKGLNVVERENVSGLFGYIEGGTVKNLSVEGDSSCVYRAGLIVGRAASAIFENCSVSGRVSGASAGGIAGEIYAGTTVLNCSSSVQVLAAVSSDGVSVGNLGGGIAGRVRDSVITGCTFIGTVDVEPGDVAELNYLSCSGGGIAGEVLDISTVEPDTMISGCTVLSGTVITAGGNGFAGGIAGALTNDGTEYAGPCTISSCISSAAVTADGLNGEASGSDGYAGGIAGINEGGKIISCVNNGAVAGLIESSAGGIAGGAGPSGFLSPQYQGNSGSGEISGCVNNGSVTAKDADAGGIVGDGCTTVSICVNNGKVQSEDNAGGIVGSGTSIGSRVSVSACSNSGEVTSSAGNAGGIIGEKRDIAVADSVNSGKITGRQAGGVAGYSGDGSPAVENCAWLAGTAENGVGSGEAAGTVALTQEELFACAVVAALPASITLTEGETATVALASVPLDGDASQFAEITSAAVKDEAAAKITSQSSASVVLTGLKAGETILTADITQTSISDFAAKTLKTLDSPRTYSSSCAVTVREKAATPEPEPQPEQSGGGGGGGCSAGFGALALFAFVPLVLSRRK